MSLTLSSILESIIKNYLVTYLLYKCICMNCLAKIRKSFFHASGAIVGASTKVSLRMVRSTSLECSFFELAGAVSGNNKIQFNVPLRMDYDKKVFVILKEKFRLFFVSGNFDEQRKKGGGKQLQLGTFSGLK
jgi:hypothetical protein